MEMTETILEASLSLGDSFELVELIARVDAINKTVLNCDEINEAISTLNLRGDLVRLANGKFSTTVDNRSEASKNQSITKEEYKLAYSLYMEQSGMFLESIIPGKSINIEIESMWRDSQAKSEPFTIKVLRRVRGWVKGNV